MNYLEDKEMRPFQTAKGKGKRRRAIKNTENLILCCVCNMPDTHTNYYHQEYPGLYLSQHKDRSFICSSYIKLAY